MKNILIAFISISLKLSSQTFETGPIQKFEDDALFDKVLSSDDKNIYTLRFNTEGKGKNYFLTVFDKSSMTKTKTIPIGSYMTEVDRRMMMISPGKKTKVMLKTFVLKDKYFIFSQQYFEEEKNLKLLLDVYSINTGASITTEKLLGQTFCNVMGMYDNNFHINLNHDNTKILVVICAEQTNAKLFRLESLDEIWAKSIRTSLKEGNLIVPVAFQTDDLDNLYYLFEKKNVDSRNDVNSGSGIGVILNGETDEKIITQNLPKIYSSGDQLNFMNEDKAVYGFFSTLDKSEKPSLLFCKINTNSNTLEFSKSSPYSTKALSLMYCGKNLAPNLNYTYTDFTLKKIGISYYLYNTVEMYYNIDGVRYHSSDNINVCKLGGSGAAEWQSVIPRSTQFKRESNNNYNDISDYTCETEGGKLSFVFIDHPKNIEIITDVNDFDVCKIRYIATYGNTNVLRVSVEQNGSLTRKVIYKNDDIWLMPNSVSIKSSNGGLIFRYLKGKKEGFGILK